LRPTLKATVSMVSRAEDPLFVLSMHVPYRSIGA